MDNLAVYFGWNSKGGTTTTYPDFPINLNPTTPKPAALAGTLNHWGLRVRPYGTLKGP